MTSGLDSNCRCRAEGRDVLGLPNAPASEDDNKS